MVSLELTTFSIDTFLALVYEAIDKVVDSLLWNILPYLLHLGIKLVLGLAGEPLQAVVNELPHVLNWTQVWGVRRPVQHLDSQGSQVDGSLSPSVGRSIVLLEDQPMPLAVIDLLFWRAITIISRSPSLST